MPPRTQLTTPHHTTPPGKSEERTDWYDGLCKQSWRERSAEVAKQDDGKTVRYLSRLHELREDYISIIFYLKRFARRTKPVFSVKAVMTGTKQTQRVSHYEIEPKSDFDTFRLWIDLSKSKWIRQAFEGHVLHPAFELFAKHAESLPELLRERTFKLLSKNEVEEISNGHNDLASTLHDELNSAEFKARVNDFKRGAYSNHRSLLKYFTNLFQRRTNYLVIRLDLAYSDRDMCDLFSPSKDGAFGALNILEHRDEFLSHLRKLYRNDSAWGYCWRLEYGPIKGPHYHFCIFLDAALHQNDKQIAFLLGEHWKTIITGGNGTYFSCNAHPELFRFRFVGKISGCDQKALMGLQYFASYITLGELVAKLHLPVPARLFDRGQIQEVAPRVGRPVTSRSIALPGIFKCPMGNQASKPKLS